MKKILLLTTLLSYALAEAQIPTYKWVSGEETSTPSNLILTTPGPRQGTSSFTDIDGNFWIYGGWGTDASETQGYFNDLWKYDRAEAKWSWMGGLQIGDKLVPDYNNSLSFDGVDDKVVLDDHPIDYHQAFTIELWFRTAQNGDVFSISPPDPSEQNKGWSLRIVNDTDIELIKYEAFAEAVYNSTITLTDNEWHHIAIVFTGEDTPTGDKMTVYLDGVDYGSRDFYAYDIDPDGDHETMFGALQGNGNEYFFEGQLDEIRFWETERTVGEIKSNYDIQLTALEDGLASYYSFNQAEANAVGNFETVVIDQVNGIQGTMAGDIYRNPVFIGEMANMRVWNDGLSPEDLRASANSGVAFGDPGLAMAYNFNEGIPEDDNTGVTNLSDVTTINDGFFSGFALTGTESNFGEDLLTVIPTEYNAFYNASGLEVLDVNGDTYDDVIVTNIWQQTLSVFINDQAGGLDPQVTYDVESRARHLAVGDFNNDNFPDFAVPAYGTVADDERVRIFFGDGIGGITSNTDLTFPTDSEPSKVWIEDMNGDTEDDLIVILGGENRFEIHYGDGLGGFSSFASFDFALPLFFKHAFLVEDFNKDSYPDIVISFEDGGCGKVGLLINDQTGAFSTTNTFPVNTECIWADEFASTDFNGDGNRDLILYEEDYFISLTGNGDGTFVEESPIRYYGHDRFDDIKMADVNSDGIEDIIAASESGSSISIHLGNEFGEFENSQIIRTRSFPEKIFLTDLDKDGFLDIVVGNNSNSLSVVYREADLVNKSSTSGTLNFDGLDDHITIPNLKIFDNNFTVEGWIKTGDNGPIFSFSENNPAGIWDAGMFSFAIRFNRLAFFINGQPWMVADEGDVTDNEWHHVAAVIDLNLAGNDEVRLYLDGYEVLYNGDNDFDASIDNANGSFFAKLGYASSDFEEELGSTGIAAASNWTDGIPFPDKTDGRAYAAEWSDGENLYVFGGQGANGIYNSLLKREIANSECPSLDGLTYTYTSLNPTSPDFTDPFSTLNGTGVLTETSPGVYTFTDFMFGILEEGYSQGDAVGPEVQGFCETLEITGSDQFGFTYTITSPVVISEDGASMTFSWTNTYNMTATTIITLDAGVWPGDSRWELLTGSDTPDDPGYYGIQNVSDPANSPPARFAVSATQDLDGNIWMFGGVSDDPATNFYNDLWKYDPVLNEWVWVSGGSTFNEFGVYGTQGISDPANVPGARSNNNIWSDAEGNIWIFGGYGHDSDAGVQYLNDLWKFDPTTLEWTWVDGSEFINEAGSYGTLGQYDPANIPGARTAALQWTDSEGIVWFFGGNGTDKFGIASGYLNDLWSYDPTLNQWAWHSGSDFKGSTGSYNETGLSSPDYVPGSRWHSAGWVDETDKLWLFSGYKYNQLSTSLYNDFWNYDTDSREWTWLNGYNSTAKVNQQGVYGTEGEGSKPHPTGRNGALAWTDNEGNFWMLGGEEFSAADGFYNDLWKYEPQKETWTYIRGNTEEALNEGVYGSKGLGSASNDPKSRWHGSSWTGQDGKLWFFGGINYNEPINNIGWLNDLWFYDPESDVYTWMGGSTEIDASGVYGIKGQASTSHIPGARSSSAYWTDDDGNFWLFGGYESFEYNNDLWKFNPNTLEWTWVSGNNFQNSPGIYGQQGVPDPANSIGARRYTDGRVDQDGIVWVFGGDGHDINAQRGQLNDLWKYDPSTNIWTWVSGTTERYNTGNYGEKGVAHPDNVPPGRYGHGMWIDDSGNIWILGGFATILENDVLVQRTMNDLWKFDVRTNMWTWVGGSNFYEFQGVYQDKGQFRESNVISARQRSMIFETRDKSLWFFGGRQGPIRNDFWEIKFTPGLTTIENPDVIDQTFFTFSYDEAWSRNFQIQVAESDDFSDVFFDELLSDKQATIPDLQPGSYYYYRANAINEIGESGFGDTQGVLTLPSTPEFDIPSIAVTHVNASEVSIEWLEGSGVIDGYQIDLSEDPDFTNPDLIHEDFAGKDLGLTQLADFQNLKPGTRYYVRLRSENGSGFSPYSQTMPFLTLPPTVEYPDPNVGEITQSSASIRWNPVQGEINNYEITISTLDDGFTDTNAFLTDYSERSIPTDREQISIEGLDPGTSYYGLLSAVNNTGKSDQPEMIVILTTPESPVFDPETSVEDVTQTSMTITWEPPSGTYDGYQLEVSPDFTFANLNLMVPGYGQGGIARILDASSLTETVPGLIPGRTYFARVRAFNNSGLSPNSNIIEVTTVPRAPTFNDANNITQSAAAISWSTEAGAETYLLDLNTSDDFDITTSLFSSFPTAVPFEVFSNLSAGTRYFARIQSSNGSGNSGDQDPADYGLTTFITIPPTPVLNDPDEIDQTSIRVSWPESQGATGYQFDVSDNFFQTFLVGYSEVNVTDPEVTIVGLSPGSEYQIRVRSLNGSGQSPNASNFDLLTLPETPIARDATNSSANVFTANWDPADGADYYILEVSEDDFQTFFYNETLGSSNPVQMTNLTAGATYKYRVKAGNDSGTSPYSNEISVVAQNTAQSLSISSVDFDEEFDENDNSTMVTVTLTGGTGAPEVTIRYRGLLSTTWSAPIVMSGSGTTFTFEFADFLLDEVGIEFEIYADDNITFVESLGNKIRRSFSESESSELPSLVFSEWQMIAIPYILENSQVTSIFNELASLDYKKQWRLMTYDNESGSYLDAITGFANIEIGTGYWLNVLEETSINVGAGTTNDEIPYPITLKQGWNQIGNPFNTSVNWNLVLANNNAINVENLYVYDVNQKTFLNSPLLNAFEGAFVWADQETPLDVTPSSFVGRIDDVNDNIAIVDGDDWELPILIKPGGKAFRIAGVGMNANASDLKDSKDRLAPPRFLNFIEMVTTKQDAIYPYFATDIVSEKPEHRWSFTLSSNHMRGQVTLEWDQIELNKYFGLWMVDERTGRIIDMKSTLSHTFYFNESNDITVHYSTDPNYVVLPQSFSLGDPYPNPASAETMVPLMLPEVDGSYDIDLSLFDLNGRKVKSLASGPYRPGFHIIEWNPQEEKSITSGIYFYRLTFKDRDIKPVTKKLIIKK